LGNITQSQYDPVGNPIKMTDANIHATQYAYDAIDRPIQETYADGKTTSFTYDGVGNLLSRTDQIGQTTTYSYNNLYFLLGRHSSTVNDSFTHDLSARMLTAENSNRLLFLAYDGANRLTSETSISFPLFQPRTVSYTYNIPGRTRTVTYPGGRVITEHTDARTRLDHIDDAASPPPIVQYSYDLGNRVTSRGYRNGTMTAYGYNVDNWILSLDNFLGASRIAGFGYDYDNEANKKFEQKPHDPGHSEAYQYDSIYRLIDYQVGTLVGSTVPVPNTQTAYNLDPVGNWNSKTTDAVTQTRQHDAVNELVKIDSTNLTYDANGNLQADASYTYTYDTENRLIQVARKSDLVPVAGYTYDALGRRITTFAGKLYFYDGARIIEEQRSDGNTQATYVYGNYVDEVLTMDRGGQTFYYHQNALWSVEAVTTSAGSVVERYSYDAYGLPTVTNGAGVHVPPNSSGTPHSAIGNPWVFTGRQLDEETGLFFYRARYYDTGKGRTIARRLKTL
jgi:YD repeat-containing protein